MTLAPRYIIVCGSRSLWKDPAKRAWSEAQVRRKLRLECRVFGRLVGGVVTVVTGRCERSPDETAEDWAVARPYVRSVGFDLDGDGLIWRDGEPTDARWSPTPRDETVALWPLHRDAMMVRWVAERVASGASAELFAVIDPDSPTHGSAYTMRCARRAEIAVEDRYWRPGT